ncbi:MAG TPA: enolase C-terminal domain-like protein [Thermoplasmata archaeon]|nr:enolase C-terminal domain-like protein [Thermoplasmata archaeon]
MSQIARASLRWIYDSRGRPTVEAAITTEQGGVGTAGAPSGESTGATEVQAFPSGGVSEALRRFDDELRARLIGLPVEDQALVDRTLHEVDGTANFSRLGGNTATAISVAGAIASAAERRQPLWQTLLRPGLDGKAYPAIVGNCLNGGRHAIGGPEIQEYHAVAEAPKPADAIRAALEVHRAVGTRLKAKFPHAALGRGDEGGWVAPLGNVEAVELLADACTEVRDRLQTAVYPGLDLAASEFYRDGHYVYREQTLDVEGQVAFVAGLVDTYGLRYLEDPIQEADFDGFAAMTKAVGRRALVVGDDLYTTAAARVEEGIRRHASNAVLIKVNQVGTLSDTLATVDLARRSGWKTVTSHRSGETPDGWLAQLAVAFGSAGLKCGLLGGERVAKLNELLRLATPPGT